MLSHNTSPHLPPRASSRKPRTTLPLLVPLPYLPCLIHADFYHRRKKTRATKLHASDAALWMQCEHLRGYMTAAGTRRSKQDDAYPPLAFSTPDGRGAIHSPHEGDEGEGEGPGHLKERGVHDPQASVVGENRQAEQDRRQTLSTVKWFRDPAAQRIVPGHTPSSTREQSEAGREAERQDKRTVRSQTPETGEGRGGGRRAGVVFCRRQPDLTNSSLWSHCIHMYGAQERPIRTQGGQATRKNNMSVMYVNGSCVIHPYSTELALAAGRRNNGCMFATNNIVEAPRARQATHMDSCRAHPLLSKQVWYERNVALDFSRPQNEGTPAGPSSSPMTGPCLAPAMKTSQTS